MTFAKHVGQPPPFDAAAAAKAPTGKAWENFPDWARWIGGLGKFDGKGLRDVVEANASGLDAVKANIDQHKAADDARHQTVDTRLAAIEAQLVDSPFPG